MNIQEPDFSTYSQAQSGHEGQQFGATKDRNKSQLKTAFKDCVSPYEVFHKNFELVHADTPDLLQEAYRLRYLAYCEENDFENPGEHPNKTETDNYEANSQHILLRAKHSGVFIGTVRTVRPDTKTGRLPLHDSGQGDILGPLGNDTVEISRLCLSKRRCRQTDINQSTIKTVAMPGLLQGAFIMTKEAGAKYWVGAMEPSFIKLLSKRGVEFPILSKVFEYHGQRRMFKMNCWDGLKACTKNNRHVGQLMQPDPNLVRNQDLTHSVTMKKRKHFPGST